MIRLSPVTKTWTKISTQSGRKQTNKYLESICRTIRWNHYIKCSNTSMHAKKYIADSSARARGNGERRANMLKESVWYLTKTFTIETMYNYNLLRYVTAQHHYCQRSNCICPQSGLGWSTPACHYNGAMYVSMAGWNGALILLTLWVDVNAGDPLDTSEQLL